MKPQSKNQAASMGDKNETRYVSKPIKIWNIKPKKKKISISKKGANW